MAEIEKKERKQKKEKKAKKEKEKKIEVVEDPQDIVEKKEKKAKKEKTEEKKVPLIEDSVENNTSKLKGKRNFTLLAALDEKNKQRVVDDEKVADDDEQGEDNELETGIRKRKRNRTRKRKLPKDETNEDVNDSKSKGSKSPLVEGTVYVEGISYDADDSDLKTFFEQVGKVASVRMPRWHDSNKPRGYAHVVFEDSNHVQIAIDQLNNQRLMGRYLKIALANAPKVVGGGPKSPPPEGCRTIFVKNLPYDCNEQSVRDVMTVFGVVKDVRLAVANTSGENQRLKGFGYVQFASEVSVGKASDAAKAGSLKLGGRPLYLDFDVDAKPKGSFRRTDGKLWKESETR